MVERTRSDLWPRTFSCAKSLQNSPFGPRSPAPDKTQSVIDSLWATYHTSYPPSSMSDQSSQSSSRYSCSVNDYHSDTVGPTTTTTYSIGDILNEINIEFKDLRGETVFFRRPTPPGLEAVRNAIRQNTKDLIDRSNSVKNARDELHARIEAAKKRVRDAILEAQTQALEFRVKLLEELLIENGPLFWENDASMKDT